MKDNKTLVKFLYEFDSECYCEIRDEIIDKLNLNDNLDEDEYCDIISKRFSNEELQNIVDDSIYAFGDDIEWRTEAESWLRNNPVN